MVGANNADNHNADNNCKNPWHFRSHISKLTGSKDRPVSKVQVQVQKINGKGPRSGADRRLGCR